MAVFDYETPRSWEPNSYPTPEQLAEWLTVCSVRERVEMCTRFLEFSERASDCFIQNHHGLIQHLTTVVRMKGTLSRAQ